MKILEYPDPFLFKKVDSVSVFDESLKKQALDMIDTMNNSNGVGLSANQVGINKRIFVMNCVGEESPTYVFINPIIKNNQSEDCVDKEGCLSFPGLYIDVKRKKSVVVQWQDLDGSFQEKEFFGLEAVCVQHEIDHLDGIVFVNRLSGASKMLALNKLKKIRKKKK
mgnify:CR=1 FL=1